MAADPYVADTLDDEPRQARNLAPGVSMPPARAWVPDRPGDEVADGQPTGRLFGTPGPNIGYARTLAAKIADRFALGPGEERADAAAVVSELGMKRAASYGRAPVLHDVELAAHLLGYLGGCDADDVLWRVHAVHDAAHDYPARRAVCDATPLDVLRLTPEAVDHRAPELRAGIRAAWHPGDA